MGRVFKFGCLGIIGFVVLLILATALSGIGKTPTIGQGQGGTPDFLVRVSGSAGIPFSGSIMAVTAGKSTGQSVSGKTPAEYEISGSIVSVTFQKQGELGRLRVEILKGDTVAAEGETATSYGVVSAATQ